LVLVPYPPQVFHSCFDCVLKVELSSALIQLKESGGFENNTISYWQEHENIYARWE